MSKTKNHIGIGILLFSIMVSCCIDNEEYNYVNEDNLPHINLGDTLIYSSKMSMDTFVLEQISDTIGEVGEDHGSFWCPQLRYIEIYSFNFSQFPVDTSYSGFSYHYNDYVSGHWIDDYFASSVFQDSIDLGGIMYYEIEYYEGSQLNDYLLSLWYGREFGVIGYETLDNEIFTLQEIISK